MSLIGVDSRAGGKVVKSLVVEVLRVSTMFCSDKRLAQYMSMVEVCSL